MPNLPALYPVPRRGTLGRYPFASIPEVKASLARPALPTHNRHFRPPRRGLERAAKPLCITKATSPCASAFLLPPLAWALRSRCTKSGGQRKTTHFRNPRLFAWLAGAPFPRTCCLSPPPLRLQSTCAFVPRERRAKYLARVCHSVGSLRSAALTLVHSVSSERRSGWHSVAN